MEYALEEFVKKIKSTINRVEQGSVALFNFLDESEAYFLKEEVKKNKNIFLYEDGKIINSSRKRFILSSFEKKDLDFNIILYKIKYNPKFYEINHRNILGSLMSLGIKRECVGDIVLYNKDYYFTVTKEINPYIIDNYHHIGKTPIELEEVDYDVIYIRKLEEKNDFVSSFRLDVIISAGFNVSRRNAQDYISKGLVFLNYISCLNSSKIINVDDIITVRHKGKIVLLEIKGLSKSGKHFIKIGRYV